MASRLKILLFLMIFLFIIGFANGQTAVNTYLNDSATYTKGAGNVSLVFNAIGTRVIIGLDSTPSHSFEGQSFPGGNFKWIVEYNSSNNSGYVLKLRINDEATFDFNDKIEQFGCDSNTLTTVCDGNCGGFNFVNLNNFTVNFYPNNNTYSITLSSSITKRIDGGQLCSAAPIGNIIFAPFSDSGLDQLTVKNNILAANNAAPVFLGNISNFTFPEDTSTAFNISGNFTEPDGENITFGFSDVENISVTINQSSGVVNLTPQANFYGLRYARFFANDTKNSTYSYNISINVTPVNDMPEISNVLLSSTDFLNRTNGSLTVSWDFADVDGDLIQGNETLWYINGTENTELRNHTFLNWTNTTKNQNWSVSARVFDGTVFSGWLNSTNLTIISSAPTHSIPTITSNDGQNRRNGTLTCNNQSTNDLDDDLVANFIKWFNNSQLISEAEDSISLNTGNYTKNDNLTCEITPFDGTFNGTAINSTNFTILNAAPLLNNSILNKSWDENTAAILILINGFIDIDGDNLTYNHTNTSGISISINNNTGLATLTPETDFNGERYAAFFAFDGINLTASNNVTLTVNDVPAAPSSSGGSSSGSSGGGGGGGGGSGYICDLDWECDSWSECSDGKQERKCALVKVPVFLLDEKCPQNTIPEQDKGCVISEKEGCSDGIKNNDEEGIDCGGSCNDCFNPENIPDNSESSQSLSQITGAAVGGGNPNSKLIWLAAALVLMATLTLAYFKFGHKHIFRKCQLTESEMKKLNEMLNYKIFKK